jgi:fumarate reductase subunit C
MLYHYAECRVLVIVMLNVFMLSVLMLNVVTVIVVAPKKVILIPGQGLERSSSFWGRPLRP